MAKGAGILGISPNFSEMTVGEAKAFIKAQGWTVERHEWFQSHGVNIKERWGVKPSSCKHDWMIYLTPTLGVAGRLLREVAEAAYNKREELKSGC